MGNEVVDFGSWFKAEAITGTADPMAELSVTRWPPRSGRECKAGRSLGMGFYEDVALRLFEGTRLGHSMRWGYAGDSWSHLELNFVILYLFFCSHLYSIWQGEMHLIYSPGTPRFQYIQG
jgi:hypothetical protein